MAQDVFHELTGREDNCGDAFYEALDAVQEAWAECEEGDEPVRATTRGEVPRLTAGAGTPRLDALFPVEAHA
ncbi:hypothetical protein ABT282_28970 [Streptomyces sp. NPDC000927]|uniref:hypothetical protein n=1 Tax=Streptomyces sp. NPDC000927 TaxID=3154371 RepID=UPI00332D2AC1